VNDLSIHLYIRRGPIQVEQVAAARRSLIEHRVGWHSSGAFRVGGVPYKLVYKSPTCETNALSQEGTYSKGIYYGRWSVRHINFAATLRQEGTYKPGGLIAKGGLINQFIRYEQAV
jgi:hypothetical protein